MSFLARFRVITKIIAVVVLLSAVAIGITFLGISSLNQMSEQTDLVAKTGNEALLLKGINSNVLAINRAEFLISSDPRAETKREAKAQIDAELKTLNSRIAELKKDLTSADSKARLEAIEKEASRYTRELDAVYKAADAVKDFKMTQELDQLHDAAMKSDKEAEGVRTNVKSFIDVYEKRIDTVVQEAAAEHARVSMMMMVIAAIGIVLGLALGFMIGQFGIAKPMRSLVVLLQQMAKGETIEITGTERKDEVGETARAVNDIKDMLAEKARQEAEAKAEQDKRAAGEREAAMKKMASEFEAAVGGIVQAAVAGDFAPARRSAGQDRAGAQRRHRHQFAVRERRQGARRSHQDAQCAGRGQSDRPHHRPVSRKLSRP